MSAGFSIYQVNPQPPDKITPPHLLTYYTTYISRALESIEYSLIAIRTGVVLLVRVPSLAWMISIRKEYLIPYKCEKIIHDPIYPNPPLAQDMTQGQFLSGV